MPIFRETMVVELVLPSSATEESLPLTTEREFGVYLRSKGQSFPANNFRSPINDEQWRTFVRQLRDCNVNHDETGYRGAQAIRSLGRDLYQSLARLSPNLRGFLDASGTARRLVIQTRRAELHLLPWAALYGLDGKLLAAGDLSIVQAWQSFSDAPLPTPPRLNLVRVLGADTNKSTAGALKGLPPEITTDAGGPPDILHVEEHGDAVHTSIGDLSSYAIADKFPAVRIALLWSCYSSASNSWGESPALSLHRRGAELVLSFQAQLHNADARSMSEAFYADVFGPAASRDPESALLRIRVDNFEKEFANANWASMTVFLRGPLDLSALPLNGPRVPAAGWMAGLTETEAAGAVDPWAWLTEAVGRLQPRTLTWIDAPPMDPPFAGPDGRLGKLPITAVEAWRGNVIRLDGITNPLSDATILELNLKPRDAPATDAADRLEWFFRQVMHYGSPLVVWTNAQPRHHDFLKVLGVSASLTLLVVFGPAEVLTLPQLVDLNMLEEAQTAAKALPEDCRDDEALGAAYFAFARCILPREARSFLPRIRSEAERLLLTGNYVGRFGVVPGEGGRPDREVRDLERKHAEEDFYRRAIAASGDGLSVAGRAKHELGYLMASQGRFGTAELFYRAAMQDLERSPERDTRWHSSLARLLRDWADLLAKNPARLGEASGLQFRARAIHTYHGRRLAVAYTLTTLAQISLTAGQHKQAIEAALDAANRFEECANWWAWSSATAILLDTLAERRETVRMQGVVRLALAKNRLSNLKQDRKDAVERTLLYQAARAFWIAGELEDAQKALEKVFEDASQEFEESDMGMEANRLRTFLTVPPAMA